MPRGAADSLTGELAYVGLGANLGDPPATLAAALGLLERRRGVSVERCSSLYASAPVGPVEQPDYVNAVAELRSELAPEPLLDVLLAVEAELGRVRSIRFGPRTCDLDLLLYGRLTLSSERLVVPHPRLAERRFVLEPLAELAPALRLPDGRAVADLLAGVLAQDVRRVAPAPG